MKDTTANVDEMYERMLMSKPACERVKMACSMYDTAKKIALASLRAQNPNATESELRALLFLRFYGEDFNPAEREKIYQHLLLC